jgi:glycerol-3-phosphate dehydrogenase
LPIGAKLVAICDENPEVVREQQYHQRVPGYTDFREMFKAEHLDLVVVSVPHHVGRTVIEAISRFIGPKSEEIRLVGSKGIVQLERGRVRRLTNDGEVVESLSREQA